MLEARWLGAGAYLGLHVHARDQMVDLDARLRLRHRLGFRLDRRRLHGLGGRHRGLGCQGLFERQVVRADAGDDVLELREVAGGFLDVIEDVLERRDGIRQRRETFLGEGPVMVEKPAQPPVERIGEADGRLDLRGPRGAAQRVAGPVQFLGDRVRPGRDPGVTQEFAQDLEVRLDLAAVDVLQRHLEGRRFGWQFHLGKEQLLVRGEELFDFRLDFRLGHRLRLERSLGLDRRRLHRRGLRRRLRSRFPGQFESRRRNDEGRLMGDWRRLLGGHRHALGFAGLRRFDGSRLLDFRRLREGRRRDDQRRLVGYRWCR
jgi:hypothetical protein